MRVSTKERNLFWLFLALLVTTASANESCFGVLFFYFILMSLFGSFCGAFAPCPYLKKTITQLSCPSLRAKVSRSLLWMVSTKREGVSKQMF